MNIVENVNLSSFTTIQLGGNAKYFCSCSSIDELREAIHFTREKNLRLHILAGGSNTIFLDEGFDGLVLKNTLKGISFSDKNDEVFVTASAGEEWDHLVARSIEKGFAGIECLSGIPGSVGATPIQNVGAYGQEVEDVIESVKVLDRATLLEKEFRNAECRFGYRQSRFKLHDAGKYIVTEVIFRLKKNSKPTTAYPEVQKIIESQTQLSTLADGKESLSAVREVVLSLRKNKSMVINSADPNTKSVGSFFMNPIISAEHFAGIHEQWKSNGDGTPIPSFSSEGKVKIPAAWLIEKSGFYKGYAHDGVGISQNHTLALVNKGGTTKALLVLAEEIRSGVIKSFGVELVLEPVVVY